MINLSLSLSLSLALALALALALSLFDITNPSQITQAIIYVFMYLFVRGNIACILNTI